MECSNFLAEKTGTNSQNAQNPFAGVEEGLMAQGSMQSVGNINIVLQSTSGNGTEKHVATKIGTAWHSYFEGTGDPWYSAS